MANPGWDSELFFKNSEPFRKLPMVCPFFFFLHLIKPEVYKYHTPSATGTEHPCQAGNVYVCVQFQEAPWVTRKCWRQPLPPHCSPAPHRIT